MTSLAPSRFAFARTHLAICQPTVESEIIESTARPEEWKPSDPARRPPKDLTWGKRAQMARCTRIASGVSPDSTWEPEEHRAPEIPPPLARAAGFFLARYLSFTQRPLP